MFNIKLFKILSWNFRFKTVSDSLIVKGRSVYGQKAARISTYLELITDRVLDDERTVLHPAHVVPLCLFTHYSIIIISMVFSILFI